MGCFFSYTSLTEEELEVYHNVTGLSKAEITHAYRKFQDIDPLAFGINRKGKISFVSVAETLPQLAVNPFRYRLCKIFCSSERGFMDFEDFLDLISVMSDSSPLSKKLVWAFRMYDFNEDDALCSHDLDKTLDYITGGNMEEETKMSIINHILRETDADGDGALSYQEFERYLTLNAGPDFLE